MRDHPHRTGACPLCGGCASLKYENYPGYQAPLTYDIYDCSHCSTSYAIPLEEKAGVYDLIYQHRWRLPGYCLYAVYAKEVRRAGDPLSYLASSNYLYAGVADYLASSHLGPGAPILEIGSGLGYLTYALVRRGYNARGLDASARAIDSARQRYGDFFVCEPLQTFSHGHAASYDLVLAMEVIEHVSDLASFLACAAGLLTDNGRLILTTPNKSAYPTEAVWHSESPPVHLWWLSPKSIDVLANGAGCAVEYVDLSRYDHAIYPQLSPDTDWSRPLRGPHFSEGGRLCYPHHRLLSLRFRVGYYLQRMQLLDRARILQNTLFRRSHAPRHPPHGRRGEKTIHLCAVLGKAAGAFRSRPESRRQGGNGC